MKGTSSSNNILFFIFSNIFLLPLLTCHGPNFASAASAAAPVGGRAGKWNLLLSNIGITAMHMQLLNNDRVVIYDRTDFGMSNISLPYGKCRYDQNDTTLKVDCTAHSVEYNVASNSIRPLMVQTDVWCSSGSVFPDGSFVQTGGFNDGDKVVRVFKPCNSATSTTCDWQEIPGALIQKRWYATNHILPDGRQIVIGGRRAFNYEFIPKTTWAHNAYSLPFLVQTNDRGVENNLYPFVFLNVDGNLFIFANNQAILFDYTKNVVVKTYPEIPGGAPRNYPSTGSAVLLPLNLQAQDQEVQAEVLVCGGAPKGSFISALNGSFLGALNTCGRVKITDPDPKWTMETMPLARTMGDMVTLPNGNVLILNGAANGTAGWEFGRDPVLNPVIYRPENPTGSRFEIQNPSPIPRMYHSTAILLRDGRVLVGGSNPHIYYNFTGVTFPTELRLEAFSPSYLDPTFDQLRPRISPPGSQYTIGYGQRVPIRFMVPGVVDRNVVKVTMVAPGLNTHSFTMNQRLLVLASENVKQVGIKNYQIDVITPNNAKLAPPGYYLLFVVHQDIPSEGIWVKIM